MDSHSSNHVVQGSTLCVFVCMRDREREREREITYMYDMAIKIKIQTVLLEHVPDETKVNAQTINYDLTKQLLPVSDNLFGNERSC